MTEQERQQLDRDGYVVLEDAMGPELLRELREAIHTQFEREGDRAGHEFKTEEHARRLANLVNKGEVFRRAVLLPRMIEGVRHVLGADAKLSSLNARSADPYSDEGQPLHVDMSAIPDERGYWGATRCGCSTTSRRRTAPPASCRDRIAGTSGRRTRSPIRWRPIPRRCSSWARPAASR